MAKLPDWQDLGATPRVEAMRPRFLGRIDLSPMQHAVRDVAQAGREEGAGIAQIGTAGASLQAQQGQQQYAAAHAQLSAGLIDLHNEMQGDTDYATAGERYGQRIKDLVAQNGESIAQPAARARFSALVAPMEAEANARVQTHVRSLWHSDLNAKGEALENRVINSGVNSNDDAIRRQSIDAVNSSIDSRIAAGALTPLQGQQMKRHRAQEFATADVLATADSKDPTRIQAARDRLSEFGLPNSPDAAANAIRSIESGSPAGNYRTMGPLTASGDRAYGAYQVMGANIPGWTQQYFGKRLTPEQFLKDNAAQDAVFKGRFGEYTQKYGPQGAARAWFAGEGGMNNAGAKDVLGTSVNEYGSRFAKLYGQSGGGGHMYDILPADVRQRLINHLDTALRSDRAGFSARVNDTVAEAFAGGEAKSPLTLQDFTVRYGAHDGQRGYNDYIQQLQLGRDVSGIAQLDLAQQQQLLESYSPVAGQEGFANQVERLQKLNTAIEQIQKEKQDPGNFALRRLPAAAEAYSKMGSALSNPQATNADRTTAARQFAAVTLAEQGRVGIPEASQQILPKGYVDTFAASVQKAAGADDAQARVKLIDVIQKEAAIWGPYWPRVLGQLNEKQQPIVRAIAAGADPAAMTRLLSVPKDEHPAKILKEQNETKFKDMSDALIPELQPFMRSLVGRQKDRDYPGYYGLAEKLAALYIRDGKSAKEASAQAYKELIGDRYDFRDTYRIPKSSGVVADDVQAGTIAARAQIGSGAIAVTPAINDIGLTDARSDSLAKFARDGTFVTSHDNSGLNLVYGDKFIRRSDGEPLLLTWAELGKLGKHHRATIGDMIQGNN